MSTFQGFDRKLNLSENTDDRDVINNLGLAPIADDLALFVNNMRNTSELEVTLDKRQGNVIVFDPLVQRSVFTNETQIQVFADSTLIGTYFVGNSNDINRFQLFTDGSLTQVVFPPAGVGVRYVRSDAIKKENILNVVKQREPVVENQSASQLIPPKDVLDTTSRNTYASIRRVYSLIRNSSLDTVTEFVAEIETQLDVFQQKKQKSLTNYNDFTTDEKITISGGIVVSDPQGINVNSVSFTSGPGIFILDTTTDQAKRAFSDSENVWTDETTDLVAASNEIVIGNLVLEDGVRISRKGLLPEISPEVASVNTFTHFVKVTVNGEEYSLCLK
jgi:hypothetical protein